MKQLCLDDILVALKVAAFRNAVRLFRDACMLYNAKAFPSAFALGVLAYEELGKALHVQRITEAIEDNPGSEDFWYDSLTTSPVLTNHLRKQAYTFYELLPKPRHPMETTIRSGDLERQKQQALYVELVDNQVLPPARIGQSKAYQFLRHFVEVIGTPPGSDWAFIDFGGMSTRTSEWLASEQLALVHRAFDACEAPC